MASVAVVIATYNNLPELRLCLKALSQQTYREFVAYVCVDGSTDDTLAYLESQSLPFVRVLSHPDGRNHGRSAARNLVLPHLEAHEWVAFLDSDSVPLPDWLERYLRAAPTSDEVLLGRTLYYAPQGPDVWNSYRWWRSEVHLKRQDRVDFRHFCTNSFVSARVLKEVGGFDSAIRRYGLEDIELGWKLSAAGLRFRLVPEARVWSALQHATAQVLLRYYEMGRVNLPYLYQKHPSLQQWLFGGRWLTRPFYRMLFRVMYSIGRPGWVFAWLSRLPTFLQVRCFHYLVLYVILRGYEKKQMPRFLRPSLNSRT